MADEDLPAGYQDTLLFKSCGSEEKYREARREIELARQARRRVTRYDAFYEARFNADGSPIGSNSSITIQQVQPSQPSPPPRDTRTDLQRLQQLLRDHPDAVRSLLAPVILDIVETYLEGDAIDVAENGQGTQSQEACDR